MEPWGALLSAVVNTLEKVLDIAYVKILRKHSDEYLKLERALIEHMKKPYDDMDDFAIADIKKQMRVVKAAFERDMALAVKEK
jgi:hypothetical protein